MPPTPEVLDRVPTPRGELVLRRVGTAHEVISNGVFLMDTRDGRSERLLVRAALDRHPRPAHVLIGGLGVGFSLVEALADPRVRRVTVVEIEPALLRWHAGPLAEVSGGALADRRVEVLVTDVVEHLREAGPAYDVACLDVDNGPDWTVADANAALYDDAGTAAVLRRLRPGGVLAVWSARAVPGYEAVLRRQATRVEVLAVPVARGEPDVVYLARRPGTHRPDHEENVCPSG